MYDHEPSRQVVVVDPRLEDYTHLITSSGGATIRLTTTSHGCDALRLAPSFPDAAWLVSSELPDMSGLELLEMLRSLQPNQTTLLVDNEHCPVRELEALRLDATGYVCKPVLSEWLDQLQGPLKTGPKSIQTGVHP